MSAIECVSREVDRRASSLFDSMTRPLASAEAKAVKLTRPIFTAAYVSKCMVGSAGNEEVLQFFQVFHHSHLSLKMA